MLHTFGAAETEAIGELLAARGLVIDSRVVPFARGQQVIQEVLASHDCPDLIRIDATWLPGLVARGALAPPPDALAGADWLPEARELASIDGALYAIPQT